MISDKKFTRATGDGPDIVGKNMGSLQIETNQQQGDTESQTRYCRHDYDHIIMGLGFPQVCHCFMACFFFLIITLTIRKRNHHQGARGLPAKKGGFTHGYCA